MSTRTPCKCSMESTWIPCGFHALYKDFTKSPHEPKEDYKESMDTRWTTRSPCCQREECLLLFINKIKWLQEVSNSRTPENYQTLRPLSNNTLPGFQQYIDLSYSSSTSHVTRPLLINKLPHCPPSTHHRYILSPPPHHHHCLLLR